MGADIADASRGSRAGRIRAPCGLLLSAFLKARGEPALGILHDYFADLAESPREDEFAGLLDQRITGVVVSQSVEEPGTLEHDAEFPGLGQIECCGFVGEDGKAVLQSAFGSGEMNVIRRDDGDEIHAFAEGKSCLLLHHLPEGVVAAIGGEKEIRSGIPGALGIAAEGSADQFDLAVEMGGDAVDSSDEGPAAPTHHAHADFAFGSR